MKTFEIRVTDTENSNDFVTDYTRRSDDTDSASAVMDILCGSLKKDLEFLDGERFVVISDASDGEGYMYNVYTNKAEYDDGGEPESGGQCTGTLANAIEMAIN